MTFKEKIEALFGFASPTYYRWKKEKRPIVELIENTYSEEELEYFLKTKEIPYKIQFANKYFNSLNQEFTTYLISSPGIKALMYLLTKYPISEYSFSKDSYPTLNDVILEEFEKKNLSRQDIIDYFDNQPSDQLLLYILDNARQDWNLYLSSLENTHQWIKIYFKIVQISLNKHCYTEIFNSLGLESLSTMNHSILPKVPLSKINTNKDHQIFEKYESILINVKNALENNEIDNLDIYNNEEEFTLNTKPILDISTKKNLKFKDAKSYILENDEGYQKYQDEIAKNLINEFQKN